MSRLWKWVDNKNFSYDAKVKLFLAINCLKYCFLGFVLWMVVSHFVLSTYDWALCFIGYPGFFIGYIGGFIYLCRH